MDDNSRIIKYWFPLNPICKYLPESTQHEFIDNVDRTNTNTKLRDFVDTSDEMIIPQMKIDYESRNKWFGLQSEKNFKYFRSLVNTRCRANQSHQSLLSVL